jgi:hypothetical protein
LFSIVTVSAVALHFVVLLAIGKWVEGDMLGNIVLLSGFMSMGAGALSAALWMRSALPGGDTHANLMAAVTTASAVIYSTVGTYGAATMANRDLVYYSQIIAFGVASGLLAYVFRETVVATTIRCLRRH